MDWVASLAGEMLALIDCAKAPPEPMNAAVRGEMAVMCLLEHEGRALLAGEISRELRMTTSRIAAVLNSLEKKGLIARGEDSRDRRRVTVRLTERGTAYCRQKKEQLQKHITMLMERLGEEDARALLHVTRRMRDVMTELHSEWGAEGCLAPEMEESNGKEA